MGVTSHHPAPGIQDRGAAAQLPEILGLGYDLEGPSRTFSESGWIPVGIGFAVYGIYISYFIYIYICIYIYMQSMYIYIYILYILSIDHGT